jgi:hypothetical protein
MPFIVPSSPLVVGVEGLILDGLDLAQADNGAIQLAAFSPPLFKKRLEWIEGADSDGAILARDPLVSIGDATVTVAIVGASRDFAQSTIGTIIDKLEEADRNPAGIPLVWTPSDSSVSATAYVLTGEVTEFPVDWESGYMVNQPMVTFTLSCAPGWYLDPVDYGPVTASGPLVELELADVPGDVPSPAVLTITEMSSQSRRTVEWGAEQRHYNPSSPWSLVLDSDSLVTSGFAGTQTTRAGAYDPGASGNSIITTTVATSWQAAFGTGVQPHIGTFRVKARIYSTAAPTDLNIRLAWRAGDGDYIANDSVNVTWDGRFGEIDLGLVTIPPASAGTQSWDGRVEAYSSTSGDIFEADYLMLIPVEAGYGKSVASYTYSAGVITGRDSFTGMVGSLNARVADAGGTWATSGSATDWTYGPGLNGVAQVAIGRATATDASPRFGILGSSNFTDVEVTSTILRVATGTSSDRGVIARWTDSSNYLRGTLAAVSVLGVETRTLAITSRVAGTDSVLASVTVPSSAATNGVYYQIRLLAFASGRTILALLDASGISTLASVDTTSTVLATGGTLATGKPGIYDYNPGTAISRIYDTIGVATPAAEPIALFSGRKLEVRHNSVERESSAGGTWGRPQSSRGRNRFWVQPAGTADRTTRVVAKASRNDLRSGADDNLSDQIKLEATVTPRCSVIPRV